MFSFDDFDDDLCVALKSILFRRYLHFSYRSDFSTRKFIFDYAIFICPSRRLRKCWSAVLDALYVSILQRCQLVMEVLDGLYGTGLHLWRST